MNRKFAARAILFFFAPAVAAQQDRDFLEDVDPAYAALLEQYNWVEIAQVTYFASRYRIVRVNVDLLREPQDFSFKPFKDAPPIWLIAEKVEFNNEDNFYWAGRHASDALSFRLPVLFSVLAWDVDDSGEASVTQQNRYEFSPLWSFDEFDNPVLERGLAGNSQVGVVRDPGPPPRTPEQIERHKWLRALNRRAFYSVSSVIDVFGGDKYVLSPLGFTPKYSILFEIPRGTFIPVVIDGTPSWNDEQKRIAAEYNAFRASLPMSENKPIREEPP